MNCLDLFSGAGMMHLGTEQGGFETIQFCEIDKFCQQSLKENFPDIPIHGDVKTLNGLYYRGLVDLVTGGSPCQSFSNMGDRDGLDDLRGELVFDYFRIIRDAQPKAFIYENVPGLKSINEGKVVRMLSTICNKIGYDIFPKILNSKNYGVPQNRNRLFIIGFKKELNIFGFEFPPPVPLEKKLIDLCDRDVPEKYYVSSKSFEHIKKNLNNRKIKVDAEIACCLLKNQYKNSDGNFLQIVGHVGESKSKGNRVYDPNGISAGLMGNAGGGGGKTGLYIVGYTRHKNGKDISYHLKDESNTLKNQAGNTQQYLYEGARIRRLTPRECLRLQGVGDDYKIVCSDSQSYKMAGNGVTVPVITALAKQIKYYLENLNN